MNGRFSLQAISIVLYDFLAGRGMYLLFALPFLLAGVRFFVAGVFGACGVPPRVSWMTSDMVLFFLVSIVLFGALNGHAFLPDFGNILNSFRELALAIQYAGLR